MHTWEPVNLEEAVGGGESTRGHTAVGVCVPQSSYVASEEV